MTNESDLLDGFHPGTRSFFVTGSALAVQRLWDVSLHDEPELQSEFITRVVGRCSLDKGDHVRIMGTKTLVREFDLYIDSDTHAAEHWKNERLTAAAIRRPSGNEALDRLYDHFFKEALDYGDKLSPTAHLHRMAPDAAIGNGEMWTCSLKVPATVIAALEADLTAGRVENISVCIKWSVTLLANEYSPVSASNIWGILPYKAGFLGEGLVGHVSSLQWRPKLGPVVLAQNLPPPPEIEKRKRGWP